MKKTFSLDNWILNKRISPDKRMVTATIRLKYPDWKLVTRFKINERRKFKREFFKSNLKKLLNTKHFNSYELIGTKQLPTGVKIKVSLFTILKLARLPYLSIHIEQLEGARKKIEKPANHFFCVKMTVSIQIEGFTTGMQSCEDRYVLVKAPTCQSAYKKVQKQEKKYASPYLNSDLRLVNWKIESYDDCFCTDITNINDFNNSEGVEVYSKLRTRKIPK